MKESDKFIAVLSAMSTGSNMVAGLLHHLGCDMGAEPAVKGHRKFKRLEPKLPLPVTRELKGDVEEKQKKYIEKLRKYIEERRDEANGRPFGAKHPSYSFVLIHPDARDLPIRLVNIKRDHNDILDSLLDKGPLRRNIVKAGGIHMLNQYLVESWKPEITLHFDEVRSNPEETINKLCESLQLNPTDEQLKAAKEWIH